MTVETLGQFPYHTLVLEKCVLHIIQVHHVLLKVQMELDFLMLTICYLYQHHLVLVSL